MAAAMRSQIPLDRIVHLYVDDKLNLHQVAQRIGRSHEAVRYRLKRAGVEMRTQGTVSRG